LVLFLLQIQYSFGFFYMYLECNLNYTVFVSLPYGFKPFFLHFLLCYNRQHLISQLYFFHADVAYANVATTSYELPES
jgi:hypothetical protein